MNDNSCRGRCPGRPWPRRAVTAALMACTILSAAACGSGGSSPTASATQGSSQYQQALAYAQCMRAHGVPNFPDPNSQGQFPPLPVQGGGNGNGQRGNGSGVSAQAVQSAQSACRHLQPGGGTGTAQQQQSRQTEALNFAKCMRAHGVPNFPDPTTANGGMGFNLSGIDTHSPQYQSANRACQSLQRKGQSSAGGQP